MASAMLPTGGSVPKGLESPTKERKEIRIIDIARKENSMTDKVQIIREEVERIQLYTQSEVLKQVLDYIDKVQKETVSIWHDASEEPNTNSMIIYKCNGCTPDVGRFIGIIGIEGHFSWEILKNPQSIIVNNIEKWAYIDDILNLSNVERIRKNWKEPVSEDLEEAAKDYAVTDEVLPNGKVMINFQVEKAFKAGAQWQKEKDSIFPMDLGEYINELSKQFPEVSFAKLSRIAVRVAKWQKEQFEKNRLAACDRQTEEEAEIERDFVMGIIEKENRQPTFDDAIKYGMKKMKQQMMAKSIDGDITFDYYGDDDKTYGCIAHDSFCLEDFGLKDKDKVKMILIKEN